jgi:hypothetical protein
MAGEYQRRIIKAASTAVELTDGDQEAASQVSIQVVGTINSGSFSIQGSNDGGTTKVKLLLVPWGSTTTVTDPTAPGAWRCDASGIARIWFVPASLDPIDGTVSVYYKAVRG